MTDARELARCTNRTTVVCECKNRVLSALTTHREINMCPVDLPWSTVPNVITRQDRPEGSRGVIRQRIAGPHYEDSAMPGFFGDNLRLSAMFTRERARNRPAQRVVLQLIDLCAYETFGTSGFSSDLSQAARLTDVLDWVKPL